MRVVPRSLIWMALLVFGGCAPTTPASPGAETVAASRATLDDGASKTIVLVQNNPIKMFGQWEFSNTSGGGASLAEIHTMGIITQDDLGRVVPRLATAMPSIDDGSIAVLPDGRMNMTWRLRPDVTWQDGTPFTADDVLFSYAVTTTPELRPSITALAPFIERVEALDRFTFMATFKYTYFNALYFDHRNYWLFPKHLLADSLQNDVEGFLDLPYFRDQYIHLGPFRVVDWGLGENMVFERYDGYFLGRPKVGRIIIRAIADPTVILTNLKAGSVDMAAEKTLLTDAYTDLREEWSRTGEGTLVARQENWRYLWFQFNPDFARPLELSQDVRLRRGLAYGFDREALRELILPGVEGTRGDTFLIASDPRNDIVGRPFAKYIYDPVQAERELASGGWQRAADGRLLNPSGAHVQVELRGNPVDVKELAVISAGWRGLGLDVNEYIPPPALGRDNEFKSKFPTVETRARDQNEGVFSSFDGRSGAGPQNRWLGINTGHYANPALDRLIDKLYATLDPRERGLIMKDLGDIMADDLPAMHIYYRISFMSIRSVVRGPINQDFANTTGGSGGSVARNAHLWERV